jgi:hypothetical protein
MQRQKFAYQQKYLTTGMVKKWFVAWSLWLKPQLVVPTKVPWSYIHKIGQITIQKIVQRYQEIFSSKHKKVQQKAFQNNLRAIKS